MTDPEFDPAREHRRRARYPGTHPRRFGQKYKELAPERYPELVAHVKQRGMTPAGQHVPILVDEVLTALEPVPGERGVDATLGYGGHAERLLERLRPTGQLLALDADRIELPKTEARLRQAGFGADSLLLKRTNFASLSSVLGEVGWADGVDFVFADLGVSSMQIDDPARGFTFQFDGPLDMRMNPSRGLAAREWLARASIPELVRVLAENADEPCAELLAQALWRQRGRLATTGALAQAVRAALPARLGEEEIDRSVRRVFQALRIEVNDEFGVLELLLRALPGCLRSGGRAALLSFHSGEDRRVKRAFESGRNSGLYATGNDQIVRASFAEQNANPRSRSAKLRWVRKA